MRKSDLTSSPFALRLAPITFHLIPFLSGKQLPYTGNQPPETSYQRPVTSIRSIEIHLLNRQNQLGVEQAFFLIKP